MSIRRFAAVVVLLATAWVPRAFGAPDWTAPIFLPIDPSHFPDIGFANRGVQFATRLLYSGGLDESAQLIVLRKAPGGSWTDELVITSTPTAVPGIGILDVAPNGAACLAFAEAPSSDVHPVPPPLRWRAAYRSADGIWEPPVTLFTDTTTSTATTPIQEAFCAIAPDGTVVAGAVHIEPDDAPEPAPGQTDAKIDVAIRPAGGSWQPAETISPHNHSIASDPDMAVGGGPGIAADDEGNFTIAWRSRFFEGLTDETTDDRHTVLVRRLPAGGTTWGPIEDLTGSDTLMNTFFTDRTFAVGPDGQAVIAYRYQDGRLAKVDGDDNVFAAVRAESATTFGAPQQIVNAPSWSDPRAVGIAPDGTAYVLYAYEDNDVTQNHVGMVRFSAPGPWTSDTAISRLGFENITAGIAFQGSDAIAVWDTFHYYINEPERFIEACRWPAGAPAPEPFRILDEDSFVYVNRVLSDRAGSVVAFWATGLTIESAAFDGGGPAPIASAVPTEFRPGVAERFTATFADLWSELAGSPTWDFGDGSPPVSGNDVEHMFAAPGTYTVTATSVDVLGNPGTAAFQVVTDCEALAGLDALRCRCDRGLSVPACGGERLPSAAAKHLTTACTAVDAVEAAGDGRKARKAAARAARAFQKTGRALRTRAAAQLSDPCRAAASTVLDTARATAITLKRSL